MTEECNRCSICCHILKPDGTVTKEVCKHLVKLKSGKYHCRIYKTRLGTKLSKTNVCGMRTDFQFNIPNCPQNRSDWENCKFEGK
jgi:hypothetical protein